MAVITLPGVGFTLTIPDATTLVANDDTTYGIDAVAVPPNCRSIIVYNMDELGFLHEKPIFETDFPGGERRLIQKPTGLRYTIVNGTVTFEGNDCTGALPGKLLRSYDMVS